MYSHILSNWTRIIQICRFVLDDIDVQFIITMAIKQKFEDLFYRTRMTNLSFDTFRDNLLLNPYFDSIQLFLDFILETKHEIMLIKKATRLHLFRICSSRPQCGQSSSWWETVTLCLTYWAWCCQGGWRRHPGSPAGTPSPSRWACSPPRCWWWRASGAPGPASPAWRWSRSPARRAPLRPCPACGRSPAWSRSAAAHDAWCPPGESWSWPAPRTWSSWTAWCVPWTR